MYGNGQNGVRTSKVTVRTLANMKEKGQKICMVTAYDATFAKLVDVAGVDAVLVGDSLGMVIQGLENTLPVTLDEMIYHCKAVARGLTRAHLVGDLPFMSYQASSDEGMRNAGRMLKEGQVAAVKLEGGEEVAPLVARMVDAGIPVMGHIGLTPQWVNKFGGFRVQGRVEQEADYIERSARALQDAGAYSIVLEAIPAPLAAAVSRELTIPTIGIGAGVNCDGQVLVIYDLLGMDDDFSPKFVKKYDNLAQRIVHAVGYYSDEVRNSAFPGKEHSF